jgi:hypothetical protein
LSGEYLCEKVLAGEVCACLVAEAVVALGEVESGIGNV